MNKNQITELSAVIIDDEANSRELLSTFLNSYCTNVKVLGEAKSVESGISILNQTKPDILFLDIELSGGTGFEILENFNEAPFLTCFITGYDQYAIKAIKYGAFDYLLKPVEISEIQEVVEKAKNIIKQNSKKTQPTLIVNDSGKFLIVKTEDIIKIEVDGNYSFLYLTDKKRIVSNEKLSHFEEVLPSQTFFRTHKSHIINLNFIIQVEKSRTGSVTLNDNTIVPIASRRMKDFVIQLEAFRSAI